MSTVSDLLDTFIFFSDSQLNQHVPPCLMTSRKITNILTTGILSSNELTQMGFGFTSGYDVAASSVVYLNVITKKQGIAKAVLSPADGIFAIGTERDDDEALINKLIPTEQLEQKFQEKLSEMSSFMGDFVDNAIHPLIKETAKHDLLGREFLSILHDRIQNTAVFILDIEPINGDKLDDLSGCHDAIRASIPPEKIEAVIVGKNWQDSAEIGNILAHQIKPATFIQNTIQKFSYTYKTNTGVKTIQV